MQISPLRERNSETLIPFSHNKIYTAMESEIEVEREREREREFPPCASITRIEAVEHYPLLIPKRKFHAIFSSKRQNL